MPAPLFFDHCGYFDTLAWLGVRVGSDEHPCLLRPLDSGFWDARGSWPYQSFPDLGLVDRLMEGLALPGIPRETVLPLTWTGVIRPDECFEDQFEALRKHCRLDSGVHLVRLKEHAGHVPDRPSAAMRYSRRTRERIRRAESVFEVVESPFMPQHLIAGSWQESLRSLRSIARNSSPDFGHFEALAGLPPEQRQQIRVFELRSRSQNQICGILIAFEEQSPGNSLHAHSFLSLPKAREFFGNHLLMHRLITRYAHRPIWLGGQPAGPNGEGVWRFKRRFANASSAAWILSIDLQPGALTRLRSAVPLHSWLPDYRDPAHEMRE